MRVQNRGIDEMRRGGQEPEHAWVRRSRAIGRPLIFAHRGGAGFAPENTWPAFERSHALGVDGFELDVRVSRDGEVMVIHDPDLSRTTNGSGRVSAMTADELSRVDAGFHFNEAGTFPFRGRGARIPRLRDLLAAFPDELFIIELKGSDPILAQRTLEFVRAAHALDRVCFGGFSWRMLRELRKLEPRACSSASREEGRWALYASWLHCPPIWAKYQAFQAPEMAGNTRVVSPRFVRAAHAAGLLVQVWTVNEEADMRRLIGWGVDGLITDRPDLARQVLLPMTPEAQSAASAPAAAASAAAGAASRQSGTATR
jgi:glycerophosphoryl diester phosphodiesterase